VGPKNGAHHSKLAAFTQLYINFEHEKRCLEEVLHDGGEAEAGAG